MGIPILQVDLVDFTIKNINNKFNVRGILIFTRPDIRSTFRLLYHGSADYRGQTP